MSHFRISSCLVAAVAFLTLADAAHAQAPRGQQNGQNRQDGGRDRGRQGRGAQFGGGMWTGGGGGGGWGGMQHRFEPEFKRADMTHLVDRLRLDDTQISIAEALLLDYESAFHDALDESRSQLESGEGLDPAYQQRMEQRRALGEQLRERITAIREMRDRGEVEGDDAARDAIRAEFEAMREQMTALRPTDGEREVMRDRFRTMGQEWDNLRIALRTEFVANMMSVLTDTQVEAWPDFERLVRRRHTIGRGTLSGESVDLLLVLNEAGVGDNERARFADVLMSYEMQLDTALTARNAYLDDNQSAIFDAMRAGDAEGARRALQGEMALRKAVRDINESYAVTLSELLADRRSASDQKSFEDLYLERGFAQIYRPMTTQRAFEAVRRFDDVPVAFLDAIAGLEDSYLAELDAINDRYIVATRAHEIDQQIARFQRRMDRMQEIERAAEPDPIGEIREERSEMDQRYRRQLESILTEDQIAQLPRDRNQFRSRPGRE